MMGKSTELDVIKFNFYNLQFIPYKEIEESENSISIMRAVVNFIFDEQQKGRGYLVDRNQSKPESGRRELFMTSAVMMLKEKRIRCSIALLRTGRVPKLKPHDKFKLVPIKEMGTIAEETHFFIDYSLERPIICLEYNYYGPRISDVEYYVRNIARYQLNMSKSTHVELYMDNSIDQTLKRLKNVLNLDIKIQPKSFAQMDKELVGSYFTSLNNFGHQLKPKFIKLEAMYQTPGKNIQSSELNKEANGMVNKLMKTFIAKPHNIDCFESFVVKYEDIDGKEEVFNLLKEKKQITKEVDMSTLKKKRDIYELIEKDFDEFVDSIRNA
jgi:hypothetical protein